MTVNEKLLKYADYIGVSQRKFTKNLGLSEGVLRNSKNLGSGYLKKIKNIHHNLNMNWLLYDEGNMLLENQNMVNEPILEYKKEEDCSHLRELLRAKDETIEILRYKLGMPPKSKDA